MMTGPRCGKDFKCGLEWECWGKRRGNNASAEGMSNWRGRGWGEGRQEKGGGGEKNACRKQSDSLNE